MVNDTSNFVRSGIDRGDVYAEPGQTITLDTGGNTVDDGMAVAFDSSGNLRHLQDADNFAVGVTLPTGEDADSATGLQEDADRDDKKAVHVAGLVLAVPVAEAVQPGDVLTTSTTDGQFGVKADADISNGEPFVIRGEVSTTNAYGEDVSTDYALAVFR